MYAMDYINKNFEGDPRLQLMIRSAVQNKYLNSPLHLAYKHNHHVMTQYLLFKGSNSELYNCRGLKPKDRMTKNNL